MELRQIKYFIAVAEYLNVSKAARKLHTSQPSLGRQIQNLEEYIGVPLFNRISRRLSLTKAGEVFYEGAKGIMTDIDGVIAKTRVSSLNKKRSITLGFVPPVASKIFPFFLSFLGSRQPDIYPILKNISSGEQVVALKNNHIDVAFLLKGSDDEAIVVKDVVDEGVIVLIPAMHPLAAKERLSLADLSVLPFVQIPTLLKMQLEENLGPLNFRPVETSGAGEQDSIFAQLSLVGSGLGFTLLTDSVRDFVPSTVAIRRLATDKPLRIKLHVAYRKDNTSATLADFLETLWLWKEQRDHLDPTG